MTLYIRDDTPAMVTVADDRTGYAVASFYYQAGADGVPRMDARALAEKFVADYNRPLMIDFMGVGPCLAGATYSELAEHRES